MLTFTQHRVHRYIKQYIKTHNYAPTTAEIAAGIGIRSRGVVHRYLKELEAAEYIRLEPNRKRNIRLQERPKQTAFQLPLLGRIAAGEPIEAIYDNESINVTRTFFSWFGILDGITDFIGVIVFYKEQF